MRRLANIAALRRQRGVVAVEMGFVLPMLIVFLGFSSIYFAFYIRQYTAAQKAVHDAAVYLAMAPRVEMTTVGRDGEPAALTVAKSIITNEMDGILPAGAALEISITCIYRVAGAPAVNFCTVTWNRDPNRSVVQFGISASSTYTNPLTGKDTGNLIAPHALARYVGY